MKSMKKLLAVLLVALMLASSFSAALFSVSAETAEETTATVTEDPAQFLYEQAVAGATAEGASAPTVSNNRINLTQTGAWRVAGMRPTGSAFADVTGYWLRSHSATAINAEYGYSTWSYTTPSIAVKYKPGSTSQKMLQTWLRPHSTSDGDRKNAFMSLYYIAETSGDFSLIDSMGGFSVAESGASGYEVYVTILANGEKIYESVPLTRVNRIAKFSGATFYLEKGQKLEINFTYITTAETYSGEFYINFDPHIALVEEYEQETVELKGIGSVTDMLYDEMYNLPPTGGKVYNTPITQSKPWRAQYYSSSKWREMVYYTNGGADDVDPTKPENYTHSLNWTYNSSKWSNTQSSFIGVAYWKSNLNNGKALRARLMPAYTSAPVRVAYTAEADGTYGINLKHNQFLVQNASTFKNGDVFVYITVNNEKKWTSDALNTTNTSQAFEGISIDAKQGDVIAIEFKYVSHTDLKAAGAISIEFCPIISFVPAVKSETYSAKQAFIDTMSTVRAEDATENATGTLTQPTMGWIFEHGQSFEKLTPLTHYGYTVGVWGSSRLQPADSQAGGEPAMVYDTGSSHDYYKKLYIQLRSCMELDGSGIRDGYYAYDYAYTLKAPRSGAYILSETAVNLLKTSTISGIAAKVYKNGTLLYTTPTVCNDNMSATIPEMKFLLSAGDEITIFLERQHKPEDKNFNHYMYVECDPTITYYEDVSILEEENAGYTPVQTTRYYAEGITAPSSITAYVKTNAVVAGSVFESDTISLEILSGGNPVLTLGDKQIVFPVDVRGDWAKLDIAYDAEKAAWNCSVNEVLVSTVSDTDYALGTAIDKLYIGASADAYNNGSFAGELADITFGDTSFELEDITAEAGLISESVAVESDCSDTGLTFKNANSRIDMYEVFEKPVATFEAWVQLDSNYMDEKSAGRLLGNSYNFRPYSQLNIIAGGKPQIAVCDENDNTASVTFDVDIRSDKYVHLAITADIENGVYKCYVDGVLADTVQSSMVIPVGLRPYVISGDYYHNNYPVNFEGSLAGLALFDDVRTKEEILGDMYGNTDLTDISLQGKWSLADLEQGLINQNGSGIDLHPFWEKEPDSTVDDSYGNYSTFVFMPDIQNYTQSQGEEGLLKITNWILNNKESENIVGVIGLGDITNTNAKSQWEDAKAAFDTLKGQVPFVFVQGNHDIEFNKPDPANPRNTTNMNTYFPLDDWKPYIDGYFEEGKIDNYYVLTEATGGQKYLMLGLEFQPRDAVLEWANEVVAQYPDYKVIVSTHGYQTYNHTAKKQVYISSDSYTDVVGTDSNTGDDIWEKFVRKHANIQAVFCGHVYQEDIHVTTNIGDNGNTVVEVISNAQTTDVLMRMSGTITIVRVSEDGTKANVNQYATNHGQYMKDLNQFEMDWIRDMPVAEVDGKYYSSLAQAVEAAADGATVRLLADASGEGIVIDKDITIDFGGFTYTVTTPVGSTGTVSNGFQLLKGNNITFKNGTLTVDSAAADKFYMLIQNYSSLTVTDMTLDGTYLDKWALTDGDSYVLSNNSGNVIINGKTDIIANNDGDLANAFDVCKYASYEVPTVSIDTTGTITGRVEVTEGLKANLVISGGRFVGSDIMELATVANGGALKLVDGVYTVAGERLIADIDGSGAIEASDIAYIANKLLGKITDDTVYDIDGSGAFDIIDLIRIKKLAAA